MPLKQFDPKTADAIALAIRNSSECESIFDSWRDATIAESKGIEPATDSDSASEYAADFDGAAQRVIDGIAPGGEIVDSMLSTLGGSRFVFVVGWRDDTNTRVAHAVDMHDEHDEQREVDYET